MELKQILNTSLSSKDILQKYSITPGELLEEYEAFVSYWTEKSPNGRKQRWQKEKVFDPSRRFHTWLRNNKKWNKKPTEGVVIYTDELG